MFDGFWYRCEIKRYSIADEYGDHSYTSTEVKWEKFAILKETPKGVWLCSVPPHYTDPDKLRGLHNPMFSDFVLGTARKQMALPTKEAALADAIRRKEYHVLCCKRRLASAEKELQLLQMHHIHFPSPIGALS
jgi:hypothetical protein